MLIVKASTDEAVRIFQKAGADNAPVVFPTDTIYGIGASVFDEAANRRIFDIKGREDGKPFPVLIGSLAQLDMICEDISPKVRKMLSEVWPAHVTFILNAKESVSPLMKKDGKIAVRFTPLQWLADALVLLGTPVTATSANLSGHEYIGDIYSVISQFKNDAEYFMIDKDRNGAPSSVVDASGDTLHILRSETPIELDILKRYGSF